MKPRPSFSSSKRASIFIEHSGICHLCGRPIALGEKWHIEHVKARAFKGSDKDENLRPAHVDCHAGKTKAEAKLRGHADRAGKAHIGLKPKPIHKIASRPRREIMPRDDEARSRRIRSKHDEHLAKMMKKTAGMERADHDT